MVNPRSHEHAAPSSGTSPLASYKEVPLPPGNQDVVDSSMRSLDNYVRS